MNCVLDVEIVGEALFKEALGSGGTLSKCGRLPAVESTGGFDLENLRTFILIDTGDNETKTERAHTT